MPNKLFRGVLYAGSLVLAGICFRLVMVRYAQDTIQHTIVEFGEKQQAASRRQIEQLTAQSRHMAAAEPGRTLAANERCIGGSIVRVETVNGVPTYTQISDGAHPVMCPMAR